MDCQIVPYYGKKHGEIVERVCGNEGYSYYEMNYKNNVSGNSHLVLIKTKLEDYQINIFSYNKSQQSFIIFNLLSKIKNKNI